MANQVQFTLNGELLSVDVDEAAGKTVNEFIRFHTRFTGTKLSCAQGGCGACTVAIARPGQALKSIPSCLTPLASVHGAALITVEGLTSESGTPHPVAERLASFGGSQCGFCTPGMVMQVFSTLSKADGGKACEEKDLEQCINGNLCRCTGYRPIMECAKSFAKDSKTTNQIDPTVSVGPYDTAASDPKLAFPPSAPLGGQRWLRPATLREAQNAVVRGAAPIAGGSAAGIYSDLSMAAASAAGQAWVDLNGIPELSAITTVDMGIKVGATVTWNGFTDFVRGLCQDGKVPNAKALAELAERTGSIAGAQVRNLGTLGGNVVITRNRGFLSDWVPPLAALGAKVLGFDAAGYALDQDLLAFVQEPTPFRGLVTEVFLPLPATGVSFKAFRVAKRSHNAHALVNAGFAASVAGGKLGNVSIVLGAVDPKPCRLKNLERALAGLRGEQLRSELASVLTTVAEKVAADLFPLTCGFGREQTSHIICGFATKFLAACLGEHLPKDWHSAEYCLHDMERSSSAVQTFPTPTDLKGPLNKPMVKTSALEQTTGRAKYTDDTARPEGTLNAALVLCPEANAIVKEVDLGPAKAMLGEQLHSVVFAEDLSKQSVNTAEIMGFLGLPPPYKEDFDVNSDLLLPRGKASSFGGQAVAILLASGDSPRLLEQAATAVSEKLLLERAGSVLVGNLPSAPEVSDTPVLTRGKKPAKDIVAAAKEGKKKGLKYVTGKFTKKSQSHFYIEGQSCLCVPDEGGITCYSANQGPDQVQKAICSMTGLKQSQVAVSMRRVGGGFGGKAAYPCILAALCADVALKKNRPVRIVLPRETDMSLVGGRQELEGTWELAVDPKGKIQAMTYEIFVAHSIAGENVQKFLGHCVGQCLDQIYTIPSAHVVIHYVKQHVPERTAVRAPGHFEGSVLMEAVMDGGAASLKMPMHEFREVNLCKGKRNVSGLSGGMLPTGHMDDNSAGAMWKNLKAKTDYEARYKAVQDFNAKSVWKKRGLSITPARYGCFVPPGHSARVDIYKDGTIQIACSGSEIGQGLHTKVGQMVSTVFARQLGAGPPMDCIRFPATSTEQLPNGQGTGGSTTSEGNMFAAGDAAEQLCRRLAPFVQKARKASPKHEKGLWFDIVDAAFGMKFMGMLVVPPNLSAVGMSFNRADEMMYETYGICASEVELDVLTGESRVTFAHLVFDIGMSYNPMVDIGQMEGAFIMGMGQVTQEGNEFDHATGRPLSTNTWNYKPPIASDIPETFKVELVDGRKARLNNPLPKCMSGTMASCLSFLGMPWKPTKTPKTLKSAKAIGEPPLLLASAPHSALTAAMVAAMGGPLPANRLPMPAKPFELLPLLQAQKPGSGSAPDDSSTATGTSVSTQH